MTRPATSPRREEQPAVGTRAPRSTLPDLNELTRRVYALMQEDLRLDRARREGRS